MPTIEPSSAAQGPSEAIGARVESLVSQIKQHFKKAQAAVALNLAKENEHLLDHLPIDELRLDYLTLLARGYGQTTAYGECLAVCRRLITEAAEVGNVARQILAYRYQGNVYQAIGSYEEALQVYHSAVELARTLGDNNELAALYNNLGVTYRKLKDPQQALESYKFAQRLYEESDDVEGSLIARNNVAVSHHDAGDYAAAITMVEGVIAQARAQGYPQHESVAYSTRGSSLARQGRMEEGLECFARARGMHQEQGLLDLVTETDLAWAEMLCKCDKLDEAERLYARAYTGSIEQTLEDATARILEGWAACLARMGRFEDAYTRLAEGNELFNRLRSRNVSRRMEALRVLNEITRQAHEIEMERYRNQELAAALAEARQLRDKAEAANQFKSEVLHMAAHDLRNPISNVISLLEICEDGSMNPDGREALHSARATAQQTLDILCQLLDSAQVEEGHIQLSPMSLDLGETVRKCSIHHESAARQKDQRFEIDEGPLLDVYADPLRLQQIVDNLLSNAIKYSPSGAVIRMRLRKMGDNVRCMVIDQGPGIAPEEMPRLFGRFQRMRHSRATGGETSTGLGLHIARTLAELSGGRLWAESEGLGHGSTFVLELPVYR